MHGMHVFGQKVHGYEISRRLFLFYSQCTPIALDCIGDFGGAEYAGNYGVNGCCLRCAEKRKCRTVRTELHLTDEGECELLDHMIYWDDDFCISSVLTLLTV